MDIQHSVVGFPRRRIVESGRVLGQSTDDERRARGPSEDRVDSYLAGPSIRISSGRDTSTAEPRAIASIEQQQRPTERISCIINEYLYRHPVSTRYIAVGCAMALLTAWFKAVR